VLAVNELLFFATGYDDFGRVADDDVVTAVDYACGANGRGGVGVSEE
jgi:hypothetical protein